MSRAITTQVEDAKSDLGFGHKTAIRKHASVLNKKAAIAFVTEKQLVKKTQKCTEKVLH